MHNLSELAFLHQSECTQPWISHTSSVLKDQVEIKATLSKLAGAKFGDDSFVAADAMVFTNSLFLGSKSWIASGAIVRGNVHIAPDCSVNPYVHIAGNVTIGRGCRIDSLASIYGFTHGTARTDIFIKHQPLNSKGVTLGEDVWVGANSVILDGVEIGSHCVVAPGAVVTESFLPYQTIAGNPAKSIADRRASTGPNGSKDPILAPAAIRSILFDKNPYASPEMHLPSDMQGSRLADPLFQEVISEVIPQTIVEVGSYKGALAIHMAAICKNSNLKTEIVCVDTWLGSWQHWTRQTGSGSKDDLRMINGFPRLYYQFLSNVINSDLEDIITPLALPSFAAAKLFEHYNFKADIVCLNGPHEYDEVLLDLKAWLPRLTENGVLIGDDYDWPGVKRAVQSIANEGYWIPEAKGKKFALRQHYRR